MRKRPQGYQQMPSPKISKKFKKGLDKQRKVCYTVNVSKREKSPANKNLGGDQRQGVVYYDQDREDDQPQGSDLCHREL